MPEIHLPYRFQPRDYQIPFFQAFDSGYKRLIILWNRRAGKDKACWNLMIREAMKKVANYFYILPTAEQAKKVIWNNIDNSGMRMLEHIPKELIKGTNGVELKIELINGSIIQLIAGDVFSENSVGSNPYGIVFSEYSVMNQETWKYISPILAVNGGWAVFNFTPRGKNHAHSLLCAAKDNPRWWTQILTVDDTKVLKPEDLEEERKNNSESFFLQEWYCNFTDNASGFFKKIKENIYTTVPKIGKYQFQIGIDLAKINDWTVITPFNLNTFQVYPAKRFNQVDYAVQHEMIKSAYYEYNKGQIVIDSTGVGNAVYDHLISSNIDNILPYSFTGPSGPNEGTRFKLLRNLQVMLELGKIKIPNDEGLINELESMVYELSDSGRTKVVVPNGMTDDRIMSTALAVWQCVEPLGEVEGTYESNAKKLTDYYKTGKVQWTPF